MCVCVRVWFCFIRVCAGGPPQVFRYVPHAPVMLTTNNLVGRNTVAVGLMNGARGTIVGEVLTDKGDFAYCVCHFPTYRGAPFWTVPGTEQWVPIAPEEIRAKSNAHIVRLQLPLVLAFALTCHKAQGLGVEWLGIDLRAQYLKPCALPGWFFVALTRVFSGENVAIHGLPPDPVPFVEGRADRLFEWRSQWERKFDDLHAAFLARLGITAADEVAAHTATARTAAEAAEIAGMLSHRGVLDVPPDVFAHMQSSAPPRQSVVLKTGSKRARRDGYALPLASRAQREVSPQADS